MPVVFFVFKPRIRLDDPPMLSLLRDPNLGNGFTPNKCRTIQNRTLNLVLTNQRIVPTHAVHGGKQMLDSGYF